ncbi:MAG: 16S rRNA (cytosine(1402)-N(4))-methyltransferase, partial [Rickettsia sp.]
NKWLKIITNKALAPSDKETKLNVRARSAKLRAAEKIL